MRTFLLTTDSLYYPPLTLISILFHKETISKCADERIKFYSSSVNRRNLLNNGQYTFVRVCVNRQPPKYNDYKRKNVKLLLFAIGLCNHGKVEFQMIRNTTMLKIYENINVSYVIWVFMFLLNNAELDEKWNNFRIRVLKWYLINYDHLHLM